MIRRYFSSSPVNETDSTNRLTKLQVIKVLTSLALPLAVAIFTIITTIETSRIARENREQDLLQTEDAQRQSVFVNYINDISHYRDEYFQNLTNDPQRLLYIRTKTLTALRKLDHERKKQILLFLKESSLLSEDDQSVLNGAHFNGMIIEHNDCIFRHVIFSGIDFQNVSLIHCMFNNVTFHRVNFHRSISRNSMFFRTYFIECHLDNVDFQDSVISESNFEHTSLAYADLRRVKFDLVNFNNVNLSQVMLSHSTMQMKSITIRNSLLPNGTFSSVDDIRIYSNFCTSFSPWSIRPVDAIRIENCTLVSNISNVSMAYSIRDPFYDRSVLIDAGQAEFHFQIKQQYPMKSISIIIYYVGLDHGVFETQQIDCPVNVRLICEYRFGILPHTQSASIQIKIDSIDTTIERIIYSVERRTMNE